MLLLCTHARISLGQHIKHKVIHRPFTINLQSITPTSRTYATHCTLSLSKPSEKLVQRLRNAISRQHGRSTQQSTRSYSLPAIPKELRDKKFKAQRKDFVRLLGLASSEKLALTAAMVCLIISSAITMSVPFALGKILDIIFHSNETKENTLKKLKEICMILFGLFLIGGLANFGRVYLFNSASLRIVQKLRSDVYRKMLLQEVGWFDTKGTGELLNRLINDTFFVGNSLSQNLSDGLRSAAMIATGTSMMIYTAPKLALVSMIIVPCVAGGTIVYGRYVRKITRDFLDKFADISKSAEETLASIRIVKGCNREHEESKVFDNMLLEAMVIGYKDVTARSIFFGLTGFSGNVIIISVLYYGGILVSNDALSIGALTSFILYAAYSAVSISGLSTFFTEMNKSVGAAQRVWDILDRQYEIPLDRGLQPSSPPRGEIEFRNVHFNYPSRTNASVLKDFNLIMQPGQTTAVVGRSGSGKSTIANLLFRFYDPQQGDIFLDGVNLKDYNPTWLRSHISSVSQEPTLFSGTIRANILYGLHPAKKIDEEEFQEILRDAYVNEFTSQLPNGIETLVGQRGLMLSGGQRQRVAIARALIKNPSILILDEATSALDSASEEFIQQAIEEVSKGRTTITIAHRLSTIRNADNIVVLENGIIVEQGAFNELMKKDYGSFRTLVRKQAFDNSNKEPITS